MEAYHISAFIDDQLELDEKVRFVETVHADKVFKDETIDLLAQEQQLRSQATDQTPRVRPKHSTALWSRVWFKPLGFFGGGLATAILLIFLVFQPTEVSTGTVAHRFVIYQPDVHKASLVGSFSNWEALAMQSKGTSG